MRIERVYDAEAVVSMTVNMEGSMERMNDASVVKQQYANASNLNIRIVNGVLYVPKEYGMFICS